MEQAVCREGTAAVRARDAVQAGELPARLAHQDVECGQIPRRYLRFGRDIDGSLGDETVRQKVPISPPPPYRVGQLDEAVAQTALRPPRQAGKREAGRIQLSH